MQTHVFLVFLILTALAGGVSSAELTSVRVFDRAEIEEDEIRLGRICRIDGGDPRLARDLEAVTLGRSPLPGKTRTLEGATLLMRLRQSGVDVERIDLQVPAQLEITRRAVTIERERIEEIVRGFIHQQTAGAPSSGGVRIKDIRHAEPVVLPTGALSIRVLAPKNSELAGSIPLTIIFAVGEEFEKRVGVTVSLERLVQVVVTRRPLGRLKPIEEDDLEVTLMDMAGLPDDRISDSREAVGKRTRRALDSGTVLRPDLLESPPIVKRGDRVRIVAESAGMRIATLGQVKQKGARGELIPVANLDSNKVIYARVVDSQTVRIDF